MKRMPRRAESPPLRYLYLLLGWCCVALGVIGAFLPLLPTTVFLLVAAWSFSRSSDRWYRWLLNHEHLGETVRAWESHHAMPRAAKRIALLALAVSYLITAAAFGPFSWAAVIGGLCVAAVALYIAHLPVMDTTAKQTLGP
jgi:uncharacterized membrane protein YbaN (DUF454 family)